PVRAQGSALWSMETLDWIQSEVEGGPIPATGWSNSDLKVHSADGVARFLRDSTASTSYAVLQRIKIEPPYPIFVAKVSQFDPPQEGYVHYGFSIHGPGGGLGIGMAGAVLEGLWTVRVPQEMLEGQATPMLRVQSTMSELQITEIGMYDTYSPL